MGTTKKRVNLICFPHAGASASVFFDFPRYLSADIGLWMVELPGRGSRRHEPAVTCVHQLVETAVAALASRLREPCVLFGYSMGALIAFEFARELRRRKLPGPRRVVAAAHRAPQLSRREPSIAHLSDPDLLDALQSRYRAIPPEVAADPGFVRLLAPVLRADLTLLERYRYGAERPLDCAISAYGGDMDAGVTLSDLQNWRGQTSGPFDVRLFRGDHFFISQSRRALVAALQGACGTPVPGPLTAGASQR